MLQHQVCEALTDDQDDAMLDAGHEVLCLSREVGCCYEDALGSALSGQRSDETPNARALIGAMIWRGNGTEFILRILAEVR